MIYEGLRDDGVYYFAEATEDLQKALCNEKRGYTFKRENIVFTKKGVTYDMHALYGQSA